MDPTDDLWTAIRRVLPGADALTAAVATELGEPVDDIRPSVLIGAIALNGQLGPETTAVAAIEAELGRREPGEQAGGRQLVCSRSICSSTAGRGAGARGEGLAGPRYHRGDPARVGGDRGAG